MKTVLAMVENRVKRNGEYVEWVKPDAGALCCVRLRGEEFTKSDVEEFYRREPKTDLQLAAGNWFQEERRIFRLGFGFLPLETLDQALEQLENLLQKLKSQANSVSL